MPLEAVVFDIGGVLELTPPTGWQERWAAMLELDPAEFEARLSPFAAAGSVGAMTLEEVEQGIAAALDLDRGEIRALMDDIWAEYLGTLNEPLAEYFAALRPRYRTGILSNSFVGAREREQAAYGFDELCDTLVYSHEEGLLKPDPRFFRVVCDRLRTTPERSVFLDDTREHVEAARALGMRAIVFEDNAQAIAELEGLLA